MLGLGFGDPFRYHPDEMKLVYHAGNLLDIQHWSSETVFLLKGYPPLYAFVLAFAFGLYIIGLMVTGTATSLASVKVYYYLHPFHFHMVGRWLSLLAGIVTIIVIYRTGKKLFSRQTGLWAAAFWAVTFLPVKNAHFGTVDILLTLFVALSFYYSAGIFRNEGVRPYVLAGLYAGLAVATKYNAGLIVLPILLAHFFPDQAVAQKFLQRLVLKLRDQRIWLAAGTMILAFLAGCPLPLIDFSRFWKSVVGTAEFEQTGKLGSGGSFFSYFTGDHSPGYGFFYDNTFPESLGWGVTLLFIAGAFFMLLRRQKRDFLILVFPVILYAVIGQMNYKAMRHLLPLVPFLLLIAAEPIGIVSEYIKNKRNLLIFYGVVIGITILPQGVKSLRYDLALYQVDTRTEAKEWIEKHVPAHARIGTEEFAPPLLSQHDINLEVIRESPDYARIYDVHGLVPKMFAHGMQRAGDHDATAYVVEKDLEYLVLDSFTRARYEWKESRQRYPERVAQRAQFYAWVDVHAELLIRFEPGNDLNISPVVEIYRVRKE